ncbi:TetR/AcrR family transcriptional regulator [Williamsia sterculiae]|nr:TetR/AcrR family transcriptional regulator [Williamsia sterculiae]
MARRGRPPTTGRDEIISATVAVLRERGIARLTTRQVAAEAGVSEGSIFYHFTDRQGLLKAVFEGALHPLWDYKVELGPLAEDELTPDSVRKVLKGFTHLVTEFLDQALDMLFTAQGDAEVRDEVAAFLAANDYGPHRGIAAIGAYLTAAQEAGVVDDGVDPQAVAYLLVSDALMRCAQPKLLAHVHGIPAAGVTFDTVMRLLFPRGTVDAG